MKPVSRGALPDFHSHDRQRFVTNRTPLGGGCPEKGLKCRLLYVIGCGPQKLHGIPSMNQGYTSREKHGRKNSVSVKNHGMEEGEQLKALNFLFF